MNAAALQQLLQIPQAPGALFPRGGAYDPALNVWVCHAFGQLIAASSPAERALFAAFATLALAGGALHQQQIADSKAGKLWPMAWIDQQAGDQLVAFCEHHPVAATPYACINNDLQVTPYSHAYQAALARVNAGLAQALACAAPSIRQQQPYLQALQRAYHYDPARLSDLALMEQVDQAWVSIPTDVPFLLMCEFTESYSDPLKRWVMNQPQVTTWARTVAEQTGLGPWRFFFEFRVLGLVDNLLTPSEITGIRATNRRLYRDLSDTLPADEVKTEFRRALITAGHGANPPKSAKNYPNQAQIRSELGYRNIIFANQVEEKIKREVVPSLRMAFATPWAQAEAVEATILRANALTTVAHEETHPWVTFPEVSWLEELKSTILGLYSILQTPTIHHALADSLLSEVASALLLHRYHHYLLQQGDAQFEDYYIGDTIFLTYLWRGGYFISDARGYIVDVDPTQAEPLLVTFAHRLMAIKQGHETPLDLYTDLFAEAQIYQRFTGWAENQPYFEQLWAA
ncbi:MAG: hypothetical protein KF832_06215 [Caldilineaceae bacterium]|nr:hypothetical protein [Caldilineaceae bacterium]